MVARCAAAPGAVRTAPVSFCLRGGGRAGWLQVFMCAASVSSTARAGKVLSSGRTRCAASCDLLYGPASLVTGIALPRAPAEIEALHWRGGAGGGPAAPWIHLMAATAFIFVVVPRVLLGAFTAGIACGAGAFRARAGIARALHPAGARGERCSIARQHTSRSFRTLILPTMQSLRGAELLLHAVFGARCAHRVRRIVSLWRGGVACRNDSTAAELQVLLLSLAATPEAENHGL